MEDQQLILNRYQLEKLSFHISKVKRSDEFHFRWLNIKEFDAALSILITLFFGHLNNNLSEGTFVVTSMLVTENKCVGENFKLLVTNLAILVIHYLLTLASGPAFKKCRQDRNSVTNI